MSEIESNSVDFAVTSPPYASIKDYGVPDQIGFSESMEGYLFRLKTVLEETHRVLRPSRRMAINIGDIYLRAKLHGRYRILSVASPIIDACQRMGFDYMGDIIWRKISSTNPTGGCSLMGSIFYPHNGIVTFDYEHILLFKKIGRNNHKISTEIKEYSKISLSEWKKWFVGHWNFAGIPQKEHVAMFPEELPYRLIRMFSYVGDTVLDPFVGSGTTLSVARALFRKGIGYDINEEYCKIAEKKALKARINEKHGFQYVLFYIYQHLIPLGISPCLQEQAGRGVIALKNGKRRVIIDYEEMEGSADPIEILNFKKKESCPRKFEKTSNSDLRYAIIVNLEKSKTEQIDLAPFDVISIHDLQNLINLF